MVLLSQRQGLLCNGEALGCFGDWLYLCFLWFGAYLFFMVFSVGKSKVCCKKKKVLHCFVLIGNIRTFVCAIETMMQTSYFITQMRDEKQMMSGIDVCLVKNY